MTLYTVDGHGTLMEGQVITIQSDDPKTLPYWELEGMFSEKNLNDHLKALFPEGLSKFGWQYMKARHTQGVLQNMRHNISYLIEMNFEYVRKAFFNGQPSRLQSLFACGSFEEAKIYRQRYVTPDAAIFEIECEAFEKKDLNFILLGNQNITGSYLAHQYWSGEATQNPLWEYIVKLPVTVVKKVA